MQASDMGLQSPIPASATADIGRPDRGNVRWRLVQSTLFPVKNRGTKEEDCDRMDVKDCVEVEDQEYCGSQGKRKRKQRKQQKSQPQRSKKDFATGRKTPAKHTVQRDPSDKGEESPQHLKKKQKISRRNGRIKDMKGSFLEMVPTCPVGQVRASLPTPDMWLEAKLSAEENSRLSAGKKIHPFFSQWIVGKCNEENSDPKSNCGIAGRKKKNSKFGPIHVFEDVKDYVDSMDWSNWNFYNGTFSDTICKETTTTSFFGDLVSSLCFDEIHEGVSPPCDFLTDMEVDTRAGKPVFFSRDVGCISSVDETNKLLEERMKSHNLSCSSQPENSLWTCKYQPEKAMQVCGNNESVKIISEWLQQWRKRYKQTTKNCPHSPSGCLQEVDDLSDNDCDSDYMEEAPVLKNVMLVTGPIGSGKSTAIYACAKEQGFQVIEDNTSDWRNGALVKKKFESAMESHGLKWRQKTRLGSESKLFVKPSALSRGAATEELGTGAIEFISMSDDENSTGTEIQKKFDHGDLAVEFDNGEIGTLMLFEEVDATLCEDSGFFPALQHLANTGKRPMILTANSENLILPHSLVREEVLFTIPSLRELLLHVNMICAAEKADIQPHVIERYMIHCKYDIRKLIMQLQFWCQGNGSAKDKKLKRSYRPLLFDLDAGHCVMPKLIHLDLSSKLSETVEREITKSLSRMTGNSSLFMVPMDETDSSLLENGLDGVTISSVEEVTERAMIMDLNVSYGEIGDYYSEEEGSARTYQVMDECSRIDFCRGAKRLKKCSSIGVINSVQETWNELRLSDLRDHTLLEHKDASHVVELAYRMSNLISEADMLLSHYQSANSDILELEETDVTEEGFYDGWYSQHARMVSDLAEHGYCLHAKEAAALVSNMGMENRVDLAGEMLASASKAMEFGKFFRQDRSQTSFARSRLKEASSITSLSFQSESEAALRNILQSIVPCKLHLAVKGSGYHEYLSSLAQMSRAETLRLSQETEKTKRRRIHKSYLVSTGLPLSPDDISVLSKHNCYGKSSSDSAGVEL